MQNNTRLFLCALLALTLAGPFAHAGDATSPRIVSLDGGTTESLFALGAGEWVVARDSGSTYPEAAKALPEIGYGHQINAESVLRLKPTLVVGRDRAMSGPSMRLLEQANVRVVRLDDKPGPDAAKARLLELAKLVGKEERAKQLGAAIDADLAKLAERKAATTSSAPRVLIVYLRPGVTMLMGEDSNAAAMLSLTGAQLAVSGLKGYKELNAEAVVAAKPDVVLCYEDGLKATGGAEALWKRPGLSETPAGRNRRLVAMDDLLLSGFGPRTGEAALQLFNLLHPSESTAAGSKRP